MTADATVKFVRRAYEAISAGDIPWMAEHTADDVVFHQGGRFPTAGTFKGRDAMFGHFMEFMTMVAGEFSIEPHRLLADDEYVTSLITVTIGKDGRRLAFDEAHIFHVVDGMMK